MYDRNRVLVLIIIIIIIIIAAVLIYSTLSSNQNPQISGNNSSNITNMTSAVSTISIQNMTFNPNSLTVKTGTNIQWINKDNTQHQVVSDSGAFQSPVLNNGSTYNFYFAKSGVYGYHCGIHPTETGTLIVQG